MKDKFNQPSEQNPEQSKILASLKKALEQSVLRKAADGLLWEVLELDQLTERLLCLIRDFFEDE